LKYNQKRTYRDKRDFLTFKTFLKNSVKKKKNQFLQVNAKSSFFYGELSLVKPTSNDKNSSLT